MTKYANADQTIGENAPLYHRQAQKDVLEKAFRAFSPEYVPYLKERVAPRQREHELANTRLMDEVKRRSLNDQFHLATKEIDAASKTKGHEEAFSLLKGMVERPEELIHKFYNKFDKDVLNTIEDDRQEQWFRRIAPSLTGQAIERGTFGSPAYRRMMQKASNDYRIALDREKTKFKQDQFNESIRHAAAHTGQAANAASLGLANTMQERQSRMNLADQRMRTDASKSAQELALSSALSSEGAAKQAQEQEKLNREYERFLEGQEHPLRMAERQAAIVAGAPQLGRDVRVAVASPSAPLNPLAASASTLASLAGAMRESAGKKKGGKIEHPLTYKKGGKVKKFTKGGDVSPYSLLDSENAAMNTPEMTELRGMGEEKSKQRDPIAEYLMSMGATMAASHKEGPWASLGHGQRAGLEAKNKAMDTNDVNKERQIKLLEAIQNTRSRTQELLADYQLKREQLKNQKEVNESNINLHNAHADYYKAQTAALPEKTASKVTKLSPEDRKVLEEQTKVLQGSDVVMHDLNVLDDVYNRIDSGGPTSYLWPVVAGNLPFGLSPGRTEDLEIADKTSNDLVANATKAMGARAGVHMAKMLEKGKPSRTMSTKGAKGSIKNIRDNVELQVNRALFVQDAYENGVKPATALAAYTKYNNLKHKNPKADLSPYDLVNLPRPADTSPQEDFSQEQDDPNKVAQLEQEISGLEQEIQQIKASKIRQQ